MMNYTNEQKVFTISYAVTSGNLKEAARQYKMKFGTPVPDTQQIKRWKDKLIETGSLNNNRPGQGVRTSASGDDIIEKIKEIIADQPGTSQRKMASQLNVSASSINRAIKRSNIKKWKPQKKQELKPQDFEARKNFCHFVFVCRKCNAIQTVIASAFLKKLKFSVCKWVLSVCKTVC